MTKGNENCKEKKVGDERYENKIVGKKRNGN